MKIAICVAVFMASLAMMFTQHSRPSFAKAAGAPSMTSTDQRVELGRVKWSRDLDAAQQASSKTGKPIFLLFQEVPG